MLRVHFIIIKHGLILILILILTHVPLRYGCQLQEAFACPLTEKASGAKGARITLRLKHAGRPHFKPVPLTPDYPRWSTEVMRRDTDRGKEKRA